MLTKTDTRLLHALKNRSGRDKHDAFIVEGIRITEEALGAGVDLKFAAVSPSLGDSGRGRSLLEHLKARTRVEQVKDLELKDLAETETPQGVVAVAEIPHASLRDLQVTSSPIVLVVDAVQDPGNLGTLIRSADAFGVAAIIALPGTVDYWNSKVVRSAAGASFHVPLISSPDDRTWSWLVEHEFLVCGADMQGTSIADANLGGRVALVVGNEGSGLRKETRKQIVKALAIPMPGRAESLNVAVAAGILLYELSRTRR